MAFETQSDDHRHGKKWIMQLSVVERKQAEGHTPDSPHTAARMRIPEVGSDCIETSGGFLETSEATPDQNLSVVTLKSSPSAHQTSSSSPITMWSIPLEISALIRSSDVSFSGLPKLFEYAISSS